jgi:hypothetical protein
MRSHGRCERAALQYELGSGSFFAGLHGEAAVGEQRSSPLFDKQVARRWEDA